MREVDARLSEALEDLQGYLADALAPLLVADAVNTLLDYPPAVTAEQLRIWAFFQFEGRRGTTPLSDLLYHAIKKIQQLEVHHLVAEERFGDYLGALAGELLAACPPRSANVSPASSVTCGSPSAGPPPWSSGFTARPPPPAAREKEPRRLPPPS